METTVDAIMDRAVATMLELPEEKLDKTSLLTSCIVNSIHSFSKINKIALTQRGKAFTEAKREDVGTELSRIFFYAGCLAHLLDLEKDKFSAEAVEIFSHEFSENYHEDAVLCSLHGIQQLIDLSEMIFNPIDGTDFVEDQNEESAGEAKLGDESVTTDIPPLEIIEDDSDVTSDVDLDINVDPVDAIEIIASVLVCILLLSERLALDHDTIMHNVTTIEKFV